MKYSASQYAKALYELIEENPAAANSIVSAFAKVLTSHQRLKLSRAIVSEFEREWYRRKNITPVTVESSQGSAVSKDTLKRIIGSEIDLKEKINSEVKGGLKITIDDLRIDNTLSRRLSDLRQKITIS